MNATEWMRCFAKRQSTSYSTWPMTMTQSADTRRSISNRKQWSISSSASRLMYSGSEKKRSCGDLPLREEWGARTLRLRIS